MANAISFTFLRMEESEVFKASLGDEAPKLVWLEMPTGEEKGPVLSTFINVDDSGAATFGGVYPVIGYPVPEPPNVLDSQGKTTINASAQNTGTGANSLYGVNEVDSRTYSVGKTVSGTGGDKIEDAGQSVSAGLGLNSKMNAWSLHKYKNRADSSKDDMSSGKDSYNKAVFHHGLAEAYNPTASNIVNESKEHPSIAYTYSYADFVQAEHYGRISNDYMITLRRFPYPVQDDLKNMMIPGKDGKPIDGSMPDLARAITWMSPSLGNEMKSILKFGTKFNWKEVESEIQKITASAGKKGKLGSMIDGSPLLSAVNAGVNNVSPEQAARIKDKGAGWDPTSETYPNKVFGPLNVIKKVLTKQQGLEFDQQFELNFYYDLKALADTSPKVAFMDTLSNILALTYNNAPFWGGATRGLGSGSIGKPFGDFNKLKSGDYKGFLSSVGDQIKGAAGFALGDLGNAVKGVANGKGINALGDSKILDNIVGGGLMKLMNGPQGATTIAAFLTGDPTGQWHVTIGNPMNPMIVCGNLAMMDSKIEFDGPLGYEGFPSKIKLTCTLKPGRPRDKGEIESMFNAGRGRSYLQPDVEGSIDVNAMFDVSAYGGKDQTAQHVTKAFLKRISDLNAG